MKLIDDYMAATTAQARKAFANHVVRESRGPGHWLLQKPHQDGGWCGIFFTDVFCDSGGAIVVTGDIDTVVFAYGPKDHQARVRWMGECDDLGYYVGQKARIGTGAAASEYDPSIAAAQLDEMVREFREAESDQGLVEQFVEAVEGAKWAADSRDAALAELWRDLPPNTEEYIPEELGTKLAPRVVYAHAALRRLCELLDAEQEAAQ